MSEEVASTANPAPDEAPTILLVDDEPSILSALRRLLRPLGYKILMANGGAAGLALMAAEKVDLVVSDMRMPEMDGVQFLEQVREHWPDAVRILLTGYADISSTIGAINRGAIHRYISKPWDDNDLQLSIGDGLKRYRLEQENRRLIELTREQNMQLQLTNAQVQSANEQLQAANGQMQEINLKLEDMNGELERRVAERTQELQDANQHLAEVNAAMEQANQKLNAANLQLEENFSLSIAVFSGLLELRDGSVSGHSRRVADMARRMAEELHLGAIEVTDIYNAGLLHEVGKIGLPDELMNKTVSLMNGQEFSLYKEHPVKAQAALMPLGRLQQTALLIRAQHERVDGQGYPDGLKGREVPIGAQIINITSTFHNLISGRLAEKVFSTEDACKAIHDGAENRYSAEVLKVFDLVQVAMAQEALADIEVPLDELRSGMVLSRDLLSPHGSLLLPKGYVFTSTVVQHVKELAQRDSLEMSFFIKKPGDGRGAPAQPKPAHPQVQHA